MSLETPYALGNYGDARVLQIMFKYLERKNNLARSWTRIFHHMPEVIGHSDRLSCLEFGTAHGGMLELFRALGHDATGTDFPWRDVKPAVPTRPWHQGLIDRVLENSHDNPVADPIEGWVYQPIIESLGLDVRMLDGRSYPYPFEDKSFDVVCCYQAVDAFGPPDAWPQIVAEFCRIARKAVIVGYNHIGANQMDDPELVAAARKAWLELSSFSAHGLRTVYTELDTTRRGLHPVVMKFLPVA